MSRTHIPPTTPSTPPPSGLRPERLPAAPLPRLWSRLDRPHQRQLAQQLAELIRRIRRLPVSVTKEVGDERSA